MYINMRVEWGLFGCIHKQVVIGIRLLLLTIVRLPYWIWFCQIMLCLPLSMFCWSKVWHIPEFFWMLRTKENPCSSSRVDWPITDCLPMTEHFGRSFSILLHFEWFTMLLLKERLLKLYESSLKCKAKGQVKK